MTTIKEVLEQVGDFAHGGEPVENTVPDWAWATPDQCYRWLTVARCFDGQDAWELYEHGITPREASHQIEVCGYKDTIGYVISNGDFRPVLRSLRVKAAEAGDMAQVQLCDHALEGDPCARAECVRVLSDSAAQLD